MREYFWHHTVADQMLNQSINQSINALSINQSITKQVVLPTKYTEKAVATKQYSHIQSNK